MLRRSRGALRLCLPYDFVEIALLNLLATRKYPQGHIWHFSFVCRRTAEHWNIAYLIC